MRGGGGRFIQIPLGTDIEKFMVLSELEVFDDTLREFGGFIRFYCHIWKFGDWLRSEK